MMKSVTLSLLQSAANAFDFGGPVLCDAHHYGEGHINDQSLLQELLMHMILLRQSILQQMRVV